MQVPADRLDKLQRFRAMGEDPYPAGGQLPDRVTVAELLALRACGMSWFDATCHTFTTLATGGFSTRDESIAAFPSASVQNVIILFMLLAGINFGLYHQLLRRDWRGVRISVPRAISVAVVRPVPVPVPGRESAAALVQDQAHILVRPT